MKNFRVPTLQRPKIPKVSREVGELTAQAAGALSVLIGVSAWSVPCAFILGGLTVILAIERQV